MAVLRTLGRVLRAVFRRERPRCSLCGHVQTTRGPSGFCAVCDELVSIDPG